jgi:hypothetical protein
MCGRMPMQENPVAGETHDFETEALIQRGKDEQ